MAVQAGLHRHAPQASFIDRLNTDWHEIGLQTFMFIVLAHWAEHLVQGFQIYVLGWAPPEARGVPAHGLSARECSGCGPEATRLITAPGAGVFGSHIATVVPEPGALLS